MTLKPRLRRFWRHNKKCGSMWCLFLQIPAIVTPPYGPASILFTLIGCIWFIVWKKDREVDTLQRCFAILEHRYLKMYRKALMADIDNKCIITILKEEIKRLKDKYETNNRTSNT